VSRLGRLISSATIIAALGAMMLGGLPWAVGGSGISRALPADQIASGRAVYVDSCASCHGPDAEGVSGRGPSLRGVGAQAADFYLQTGRMPLPSPDAQPVRGRPAFSQTTIAALVAYVGSLGGPGVPAVDTAQGDLSRGYQIYANSCSGCHQITARGGIVPGASVPSLGQATPTQIAEAVRIGPYLMPKFSDREIDQHDLDSLAAYVQSTRSPSSPGGWSIGLIGAVPEGMVAWLIGLAALLVVARLIGERSEQ
jgi:ubiquinol-cytochrome c reductase cytochrome c subunit